MAVKTPAEVYEEFFVPAMLERCTAELLASVPARPGERVLDVACGTGVVARAAAAIVGPEGHVTGLDLRPGMLAVAAAQPALDGAPRTWVEGDATALPFGGDSFDLVLCQQGMQFFADRAAAAGEMRRVLVSGGRAGLAVWQGFEANEFFAAMTECEASHLEQVGISHEELAAPFSFGDPDELSDVLVQAGFTDVQVEPRSVLARFPADGFVENVEFGFSAMVPEFVEDPTAFRQFVEAVERDLQTLLARHREGAEIVFPIHLHVGVGMAGGG